MAHLGNHERRRHRGGYECLESAESSFPFMMTNGLQQGEKTDMSWLQENDPRMGPSLALKESTTGGFSTCNLNRSRHNTFGASVRFATRRYFVTNDDGSPNREVVEYFQLNRSIRDVSQRHAMWNVAIFHFESGSFISPFSSS